MPITANDLRSLFKSPFDLNEWTIILHQLFDATEIRKESEQLEKPEAATGTESGFHLGKLSTSDGYEIGLFYYKCPNSIIRKRVGLHSLVKSFTKYFFDAVLVVFDDGKNWRLSFICDLKGDEKTSPKRFSFVFGNPDSEYRTAVERLSSLQRIGVTFKNLREAFSVETLSKEFYKEIYAWYESALKIVKFPGGKKEENLIRLITRLMFVWFLKQKKLVPDNLFDEKTLSNILKKFNATSETEGNYYNAILQNLFFATLNCIDNERAFTNDQRFQGKNVSYEIKTQYQYHYIELFQITEKEVIRFFAQIPFLNGGLFDCLDIDGFSHEVDQQAFLPNSLFFVDDNDGILPIGILSILKRYNWTVEENTPSDADIALDPELLGKMFENLLASYNPETQTTARKATGSFYTPREIVDYMVTESLVAYFCNNLTANNSDTALLESTVESIIRSLFQHEVQEKCKIGPKMQEQLITAIDNLKILDPACGSGAFPMGILNKLAHILHQIDPKNEQWKNRQIAKAEEIPDIKAREDSIKAIEATFENNELDYGRKLYLIENCIFGVDIQPIAIQISKLRFFISLVSEQKLTSRNNNPVKVMPLPNLETKFVIADTLSGIQRPQKTFGSDVIVLGEKEQLREIRHKYFTANTREKKKLLQKEDKKIRNEIAVKLQESNWSKDAAQKIAAFDPYEQNTTTDWFDPEWMFGLTNENAISNNERNCKVFDIVIGNPPYVVIKKGIYKDYTWGTDLYTLFYELSFKLLKDNGILSFITPRFFLFNKDNFEMRKYLLNDVNILSMVECKPFDAITENEISIIKKESTTNDIIPFYILVEFNKLKFLNHYCKKWSKSNKFLEINPYLSKEIFNILNKIEKNSLLLKEISQSKRGAEISKNDLKNTNNGKPILIGSDVQRFVIEITNAKIDVNHKEYLRLKNYFNNPSPMILLRRVAKDLIASISESNIAFSKNLYGIRLRNPKNKNFILALLNSTLLNFYYKYKFSTKKEDVFPEIQTYFFEQLPITNTENQQPIMSLVEKILSKKQHDSQSDTSQLEAEIDANIFHLYGVTEKEMMMVLLSLNTSETACRRIQMFYKELE
jgi:hypothetical protein